jgi:isocitrate dehydrogenase
MSKVQSIAVAYGDGIGPEIMDATLKILKEANARLKIETIDIGEDLYRQGYTSGIPPQAWDTIHNNKIILKSPITTPQGGGYKSLNVTIRKLLGLYSNVRPCKALSPYIKTFHPETDVVIVRENEEDLYAGIEYRQSPNTRQAIKLVSHAGCENIIRYAFEYAVKNNRKKVTCMTKDNIMKFADGLFHEIFKEIATEYPEIESNHYIIDIGAARLANRPSDFDVVVTLNLYGDIISDIVAEVSGSVGMAGSANIGKEYAMFEAIHGSAPDIAGKNIANPSGLINAAIMMLVHIGQPDIASNIHNAWLKTIEQGIHTADMYNSTHSKQKVGTKEFAQAIIANLGKQPQTFTPIKYSTEKEIHKIHQDKTKKVLKQLVGVDVFIDKVVDNPEIIADKVSKFADKELRLQFISFKGLKVWPATTHTPLNLKAEFWRLRFVPNNQEKITSHKEILYLLNKFEEHNIDFIQTINLYTYDGKLGFALAQGE